MLGFNGLTLSSHPKDVWELAKDAPLKTIFLGGVFIPTMRFRYRSIGKHALRFALEAAHK
jgi:hypothetical protein